MIDVIWSYALYSKHAEPIINAENRKYLRLKIFSVMKISLFDTFYSAYRPGNGSSIRFAFSNRIAAYVWICGTIGKYRQKVPMMICNENK